MHPAVAHLLVVVQDEHGLAAQGREVLGQGRAQVGGGHRAGEAQQAQGRPPGAGEARTQRGHQVGDEPRRVVARVQGDPGRRRGRPGGEPLAQQGGLAAAAGAAEEHQRGVRAAVEPRQQAGPGDGVRGQAGLQQLAPPHHPPARARRAGVPLVTRRPARARLARGSGHGFPLRGPGLLHGPPPVHRTAPQHRPTPSPPTVGLTSANTVSIAQAASGTPARLGR